jgi:hypothetical protein
MWLNRLQQRWIGRAWNSRPMRRLAARRPARPRLEILEDRITPTTITVTDPSGGMDNPATITVATLGSKVTLIDAINAANNTSAASGGSYTIDLPTTPTTITFSQPLNNTTVKGTNVVQDQNWYGPDALPAITSNITIQGNGDTLAVSGTAMRFFYVSGGPTFTGGALAPGSLTLEDLTLKGGVAQGGNGGPGGGGGLGAGGAIFNQGTLTLTGDTLTNNEAIGGNGGSLSALGGGGGMGSNANGGTGGGFGGSFSITGGPSGGTGSGGGGGGAGFLSSDNGSNANGNTGDAGGGTDTFGGAGAPSSSTSKDGGAAGDGGGGGAGTFHGSGGGGGGVFGSGGGSGGPDSGGGGGGIGGGGGSGSDGGGGGFGGGGGGGSGGGGGIGGDGGFGGGGGAGETAVGTGGFGGGTGATITAKGGGAGGGAGMGGAVFNMFGTLTITNSTLSGNTAQGGISGSNGVTKGGHANGDGDGGAVFNLDGTATLTYATLANNTSSTLGGGVFNFVYGNAVNTTPEGGTTTATLTLDNSIVGQDSGSGEVVNFSMNGNGTNTAKIDGSSSLVQGNVKKFTDTGSTNTVAGGAVSVTSAPQVTTILVPDGGSTMTLAPMSTSPALGAGSGSIAGLPTKDQRGIVRPSGYLDDGAVEMLPTTISLSNVTATYTSAGQTITLTANVAAPGQPPLSEGSVIFTIHSAGLSATGAVTAADPGVATATLALPSSLGPGTYTIDASFVDSPKYVYAQSMVSATLTLTAPPPSGPPALNVPPLLAFFDSLLAMVEKLNADGTVTVTDSIFGFPLVVANFDSSGNLVSASFFGIALPNWVWNL